MNDPDLRAVWTKVGRIKNELEDQMKDIEHENHLLKQKNTTLETNQSQQTADIAGLLQEISILRAELTSLSGYSQSRLHKLEHFIETEFVLDGTDN